MKNSAFFIACALFLIVACGGTSTTGEGPDTSVTIDQIVGIWKVDSVEVVKDTCHFPGMELDDELGTYSYIEKTDATHVSVYDCGTDATCASKNDPETYEYAAGRITVPGGDQPMGSIGACSMILEMADAIATVTSASSATFNMSASVRFDGDCDAAKTMNANDPAYPDKTVGDYDGCQIQVKQINKKQP